MTAPQPQQKHPDDLFLITREELDRCYNQMSISGYKVSANYVEAMVLSRPHISTPTLPDEVCRICEDCRVKHDTAIRNSERERVLDAVQDHNDGRLEGMENLFATPSNERTESAQDIYLKEAYFELTLVKHLIESLRREQP